MTIPCRYYRVPADTPTFPGFHPFGSARWLEGNWPIVQPELGQVIAAPEGYDNGSLDLPVALPVLAGGLDCITNGQPIQRGLWLDGKTRLVGRPTGCFTLGPIDDFAKRSDVFRCQVQAFWAERILQAYRGDIAGLIDTLQANFPGAICEFHPGSLLDPFRILVVHPLYGIAMIGSTSTLEQALAEVIQSIGRPADQGGFSSTTVWANTGALALRELGALGLGGEQPVLLGGHSYGGAAAFCAAGYLRIAWPNRDIRVLTFGAPKPGDVRLRRLVGLPTRACALRNAGDPITTIPPDPYLSAPIEAITGFDLSNFGVWKYTEEIWTQNADGSLITGQEPTISTAELLALLQHVWTTGTFLGYIPHTIEEYIRRLRLRCPKNPVPIPGNVALRDGVLGARGVGMAGALGGGRVNLRGDTAFSRGRLALRVAGRAIARGRVGVGGVLPGADALGLLGGLRTPRGKLALRIPGRSPQVSGRLGLLTGTYNVFTQAFIDEAGTSSPGTSLPGHTVSFQGPMMLVAVASFSNTGNAPVCTCTWAGNPLTVVTTELRPAIGGLSSRIHVFTGTPAPGTGALAVSSGSSAMLALQAYDIGGRISYTLDIVSRSIGNASTPGAPPITTGLALMELLFGACAYFIPSPAGTGWEPPMNESGGHSSGSLSGQQCWLETAIGASEQLSAYTLQKQPTTANAWSIIATAWN